MSDTTDEYAEKLSQAQLDAMVDLHTRFLNGRLGGRRAALKSASDGWNKSTNATPASFAAASVAFV